MSNRGPIGYSLEDGERVSTQGRGRPRDRARAARLPARRDLDRQRDLGRGPRGRGGRSGRGDGRGRLALSPPPRHPRPRGLRALLQRRRESGALVRPARALGAEARARTATSSRPGGTATWPSTGTSQPPSWRSSSGNRPRPCFFHDYHLYVAPRLVRERRPDVPLAHFIAHPVGGRRRLDGPAAARSWSRSTRACSPATSPASTPGGGATRSSRAAPRSGSTRRGRSSPRTRSRSTRPSSRPWPGARPVLERERNLLSSRPETMILRVDRTDPSKNVPRGLEAFRAPARAAARAARPGRHARAARPVAAGDRGVRARSGQRIEAAAAAVEARFPGALRLRLADDFPQSIAAYKQFDVLLVNAVMDGLNLVAKEAPLVNTRDGVLVLSVNAGRARGARPLVVSIDPFDVDGSGERAGRGARAAVRGAAPAARGHPGARSPPRPRTLDRGPAGRPRPREYDARAMSDLSHVDESGAVRMVDVGSKPMSRRRAVARASVRHGARDGAPARRAAERATPWRPRSSPGSWPPSGRAT